MKKLANETGNANFSISENKVFQARKIFDFAGFQIQRKNYGEFVK